MTTEEKALALATARALRMLCRAWLGPDSLEVKALDEALRPFAEHPTEATAEGRIVPYHGGNASGWTGTDETNPWR